MARPTDAQVAAMLREMDDLLLTVDAELSHAITSTGLGRIRTSQGRARAMAEQLDQPRELPRYGVTWDGDPRRPIHSPRPDGYWTPWHVAMGHPSMPEAEGSTLPPRPVPIVPPLEPLP
jgi:hypothetical protein